MNNFLLICSKLSEEQTGGVQTRIINYASNFSKFGVTGTVLSIQEYTEKAESEYHGSTLIKYPKKYLRNFLGFFLNLLKKEDIDAIHILEGTLGKLQIVSLIIARLKGIPVGISLYGGEMWDIRDKGSLMLKLKLQIILTLANKIAVNSKATRDFLPMKYQSKSFLVYPGANQEYLKYLDIPTADTDRFELLYVGRVFRRKGADDIIRAIDIIKDQIPNIHLNVIGASTEGKVYSDLATNEGMGAEVTDSIGYYKALADKLGVGDKVDFVGEIKDPQEISGYYQNCDIFIMTPKTTNPPSGYESFGCVYLEANLFGKPVIGTKHYGVKESVLDGKNGLLVNENDPRDLAQAILKLYKNPKLRNSLGEYGKKRVLNRYMDINSTKQLLSPYFSV